MVCSLLVWLLSLGMLQLSLTTLLHLSIVSYFLLLSSIPLYRYTKVSLSIHQMKDIWAGKHNFSYLNNIPSYRYTKTYAKSSLLVECLVPPHYK